MKIRDKILVSFSSTVIVLTALAFLIIYFLFSEHREEEFQQRQKEKITSTLNFITEVEKADYELVEAIDRSVINSLMDEKLLIFDNSKNLVYSNLDDVPLSYSAELLGSLNSEQRWIETKGGLYDVVAVYFKSNGKDFYGISKAHDTFGYRKLVFLRNSLILLFGAIVATVVFISLYLAKKISDPISALASRLSEYRLGEIQLPGNVTTTTYEIKYLDEKFDELVRRINETFAFQRYSIQHISHQLKTPITVLVSELERIKATVSDSLLADELQKQIAKTKLLADIINVLLSISKVEAGQSLPVQTVRIDEVLFDIIADINTIHPDFRFEINYLPADADDRRLVLNLNEMLIRQAFQNLLNNCITYSSEPKAEITFDTSSTHELKVTVSNFGTPIAPEEEKFLFSYFFRGSNSQGKIGFGLGLVLTKKIIGFSGGSVTYANPVPNVNVFQLTFPLS